MFKDSRYIQIKNFTTFTSTIEIIIIKNMDYVPINPCFISNNNINRFNEIKLIVKNNI